MSDAAPAPRYYPVFLNLAGQQTVVLGGGAFALAKVSGLLGAGARVTLVAETLCAELEALAGTAPVTWLRRPYRTGDLAGAMIAFDASEDDAVNQASWRDAEAAGVQLNVVDRPQRCRFIAPAILRRGDLQIAISTSGQSPFMASQVRDRIERMFGEEWGAFVGIAGRMRRALRERNVPVADQFTVFRRLLSSNVRSLLTDGRAGDADRQAAAITAGDVGSHGRVVLVGAGPGDPGLLSVAACDLLADADVVFHDALIHPGTLRKCGRHTEIVDVGKRSGGPSACQEDITSRMIEAARRGRLVVRLKGGDPFVFGRGGEEMAALRAHGVDVGVIAGITSAIAAAGIAGIPLTMRGVASSVVILSGHSADPVDLARIHEAASGCDTVVVLMPVTNLEALAACLRVPLGAARPAAVIAHATMPGQQVVTGSLADIAERAGSAGVSPPAVLVVGDVVLEAARTGPAPEPETAGCW